MVDTKSRGYSNSAGCERASTRCRFSAPVPALTITMNIELFPLLPTFGRSTAIQKSYLSFYQYKLGRKSNFKFYQFRLFSLKYLRVKVCVRYLHYCSFLKPKE